MKKFLFFLALCVLGFAFEEVESIDYPKDTVCVSSSCTDFSGDIKPKDEKNAQTVCMNPKGCQE